MTRIKSFLIAMLLIPAIFVSCESAPLFHHVSYDAGSYEIASVKVKHGEMLGEKNLPILGTDGQGNEFDGWYLDGKRISAEFYHRNK